MLRKIFTTYFFVTWLAVTFAAGLVWLDHFRVYEAETDILIVEKGAVQHAGENLSQLAGTLSFYNSVLSRNDNLDDPFVGQSLDARKNGWHSIASITRQDESGVYVLKTVSEEQEQAKLLAQETVGALFDAAGRYYNVQNDIDVRIVDGPIVRATVGDWMTYVLSSLLSGFGITFAFFFLLMALERATNPQKTVAPRPLYEETEMHISAETFRPSKPTHWNIPTTITPPIIEKEELPQMTHESKAAAPANLPIFEEGESIPESIQYLFGPKAPRPHEIFYPEEPVKNGEEKTMAEPQTHEPTDEEYKRRLNELLSGKLK